MKTVYKYPLKATKTAKIVIPAGAEILCVQVQNGEPQIWALVDTEAPSKEDRLFHVRGTGHPMTGLEGRYVGTFQIHGGALVFHVFEDKRVPKASSV